MILKVAEVKGYPRLADIGGYLKVAENCDLKLAEIDSYHKLADFVGAYPRHQHPASYGECVDFVIDYRTPTVIYKHKLAMAQKTNSDDRVSSWSSFDDSLVVGTATPSLSLSSGDEDRDEDPESLVECSVSGEGSCQKTVKDKLCLVCGDKALGYNFNAITCESCKAFFRRNAFKEIRGRCEGKCQVTVESRSYCKKCRLAKCFTVGMKRDLILTDKQKRIRHKKIMENRFRRLGVPVPEDEADDLSFVLSPTSSNSQDLPSLSQMGVHTVDHTFTTRLNDACLLGLTSDTQDKLREVINAFRVSFDGPMEHQPVSPTSSTQFLNMADTSVKRLVKMTKHIRTFKKIEQLDQIALLKGAVVEVLILRSAKMFDAQSQGWNVDKNGCKHTVHADALLNSHSETAKFFNEYQQFSMALLRSTQADNIVIMLLIVLAVLSPDREKLLARDIVAKSQEEYAEVLREYVAVRYPQEEQMFARVMVKLAAIREMNEMHMRMLLHMKVDELEPLIVEIFDVN